MEKIINTLGLAIIASKYAVVILLTGLTLTTGAIASEAFTLVNFGTND